MKHLSAYMLLVLSGNAAPSKSHPQISNILSSAKRFAAQLLLDNHFLIVFIAADQVEKLLKDVGVAADKEALKVMIEKVKGKSIPELIKAGSAKFASMPSGGASAPAASAAPAKKEAAKKEEEKPKEEEADIDMGDLFGGF